MKIAFNNLALRSEHKTRGIGYYADNLLKALSKIPKLELTEFYDIKEVKDVDLVHYPQFDLFKHTLPLKKKFPTVVTIHDLTPLLFPQHFPPGIRGRLNLFLQKRALRNTSAVITVSNCSKKDIGNVLNVNTGKVFTIYNSYSNEFKKIDDQKRLIAIRDKFKLPEKFALFVGNVNWNKNLINLTKACLESQINLVMVGAGFKNKNNLNHPELKSYKYFLEEFANNKLISILGFVETAELVVITNLASVTLFPSFYEGFGLPILESQACGTPVITSNLSSMPEVAGDGAILVDPYNYKDIANAIKMIVLDKDRKEQLVKRGFENIKRFSWDKCASETLKVYQQVSAS